MKLSSTPTNFILVKADSQSEWDQCNFALITCDDNWKEAIKKKLEAIGSFDAPDGFLSFRFCDNSVEFYQSKEDEAELVSWEKEWSFVTLTEEKKDSFEKPESRLDPGSLILYKDGTGFYKTYGKHTNEEFYTAELPLRKIMESIQM